MVQGSGKTLAFGLPILQALMEETQKKATDAEQMDSGGAVGKADDERHLRALILAPTRELAIQVLISKIALDSRHKTGFIIVILASYCKVCIYDGRSSKEKPSIAVACHILIRLLSITTWPDFNVLLFQR